MQVPKVMQSLNLQWVIIICLKVFYISEQEVFSFEINIVCINACANFRQKFSLIELL